MLPKKLHKKLEDRKVNNAFRQLSTSDTLIDFSSNDYLGFSKSETIFNATYNQLKSQNNTQNGATGSRLLSGNHQLHEQLETTLSKTHHCESALVFNSGYDANIGFFSSVPQRGDIILYDEFSHASIRDGILLSHAKSYKFKHNDLSNLKEMLKRVQHDNIEIYIVTESVFSMDGDSPGLEELSKLCKDYSANLIIDEAHALGIFDYGLVQQMQLENEVFARIVTFGKALGCHGAAILGSQDLKDYLINFSRSLIYTTALPPHSVATIQMAYNKLVSDSLKEVSKLHSNIAFFNAEVKRLQLQAKFITSNSAIHCCIISGNTEVKSIAHQLQNKGFNVKPILSPTVSIGDERLRFCLHSYNSEKEISEVLSLLATFV
ncbi:aminotransferase class I/II-fold pyridoxal phosphate-dependent enzyme [Winogradskyella immobilis]|uniref:Pyridoxal phosphate-dependent aminotransferase family protein n=1 Tax=Winogradskyella immobilis TaxID=2816852 RepID=A0ABS8EPY7_9FLAO|nr:pyridoxal phosphate-dependent aminotransferase family protein [Winogradskyella immobilis]MCC1485281.1 pyridoxal phosphate-dependent aminotransferase family protein [Winogradskyella immobilis]MCG0017373.1 pyridoxal phosphate-dependent aminotransferase family protein [Winogradskyella immobilis]